jgi:putative DNA primase/helicase
MESTKAASAGILRPVPENIPDELKDRPQWVVWRVETRDGMPTKVLYQSERIFKDSKGKPQNQPIRASATDLATWGRFEDAFEAYDGDSYGPSGYDGIGFVFSSGDPYTGIDLDKVRNPETGEIKPEAREIMDMLDGYQELSPSGTGVHIIVRGKIPSGYKNRAGGWIEAYSQERYFTMTGRVI